MSFNLGPRSRLNLRGVKPELVCIVELAIKRTPVDFTVIEGVRTAKRQRELVLSGASRTLDSRHLTGDAVDLVPYVGGRIRWDWPLFYPIAHAMRSAAREVGVGLRWGGFWGDLTETGDEPTRELVSDYVMKRRTKDGLPAFIDGPHFELLR